MVARADRSLLPGAPHAGSERAAKGSYAIDIAASRAFNLDAQALIDVTDPDTCPADALPFLAWACSVDEWPEGATDVEKRAIIKASAAIHRHKGTLKSIKDILAASGYGDATIQTGADRARRDGTVLRNRTVFYGGGMSWAEWSIVVSNSDPLPSAELVSLLVQTAPARCRLISVGYQKLFFRHNAAFTRNGTRKYQRTYTEV
jgi:phage tail P2-like protein